MNINEIQRHIDDFVSKREWHKYHTPKNLAIALSVEVSELLEIFQWMNDKEVVEIKDDLHKIEKIREEFADSMIYLLRFADVLNIDIEKAVLDKIEKNIEKYPVEVSKGTFVKYSERKK